MYYTTKYHMYDTRFIVRVGQSPWDDIKILGLCSTSVCQYVCLCVQGYSSGLDMGWVDLDLGSSPGWWAATVAAYCPGRMVEHPKAKSTQPMSRVSRPDE